MAKNFESSYQTIVNAPVEKVWEALTLASMVKEYFFGTELVTDWKVGHPIYFRGSWEGQTYEDKGIVQEYIHCEQLTFSYLSSWSGKEDFAENYLTVSYEVKPVKDGTQLTISQSNYDSEKIDHSIENWKMVIEGLKKLVE